jgi:hypothetical protein
MEGPLLELLRRQIALGLRGVAGTRISVRIPVSEPLINEAIAISLPPGARVREAQVSPRAHDRARVRLVVSKPSFLPPITFTVAIERQPSLPDSPDLVLRLEGAGTMLTFAGPALAFLNALPPGILMRGDQVFVNMLELARNQGLGDWLRFVERLQITTEPGQIVITVEAAVPADGAGVTPGGSM